MVLCETARLCLEILARQAYAPSPRDGPTGNSETNSSRRKAMEHIIAKLLQNFEEGKMTRRQLIQSLALAATAASAASAVPAAPPESRVVENRHLHPVAYHVAHY